MMASLLQMNTASTSRSRSLPSNTVANPKGELKAITTSSGIVIDGTTVPTPPQSINPEVNERVEETFTDLDLAVDPLHPNIPYPSRMLKQKQQEKDEVQIHKFWQMFKQLHINITLADTLILMPNELKCKALSDLGASINLMPLSVGKKLGLLELISTRMTLELANRAIYTPAGITRDVFIPVGKFTFPADFVIVDYERDPRVPLILGRPFLQTARALIDVYGEEMILHDGDERLTLNMRHDTSSYSNQPQKESINLINVFNNSSEDFFEDLFSNQPSGNPTFSSHPKLTSPEFDIKSDLKEIEFLLYQDIDSSVKDSIDLANHADNVVDSIPEMFIDEHALDYSSPLIFNEYDDDFPEIEFDAENVYDNPFDSKGEKIKESKLLIDELDLPCDFLPSEYDSFISHDFSRVDALSSTNNEDKIFNPCILSQEKPLKSLLVLFKIRSWPHLMRLWCLRILILRSMKLFSSKKFLG
nr:hypothetical protein [Tanacetum cinerariifolium]